MGFHPTKANPCVIMRENLQNNCCEYIAVYVDDLYIASKNLKILSQLLKPNTNSKLNETQDYLIIWD